MDRKHVGVVAVLAASIMWAIEPVGAKLSYENADFIQTSTIRALVAVLIALAYIGLSSRPSLKVCRRQVPPLVYIGLAGTLFADLTYFFALQTVPVINAVLIGHLQPMFVMLMGFMWLRGDVLNTYDYAGIACMMGSAVLVTAQNPGNLLNLQLGTQGDLLVLVATVAWASTAVVMRRFIKELHAGTITFYRFLIAAIVFLIYASLTSGIAIANIYQIMVGIVVGLGTILYYEGLKRVKAVQVAALELASPFFAVILGFAVLDEMITIMQAGGMGMLIVGILLLGRRE
jgi:drug/metabolite transporter (DMT)-like permease